MKTQKANCTCELYDESLGHEEGCNMVNPHPTPRKEDRTHTKLCGCTVHFLGRDVVSITKCGTHTKPHHTVAPTASHTPTPWKVGNLGTIWTEDLTTLIAHTSDLDDVSKEVERANAAFIVQAVNAYEELVDACKLALQALENGKDAHGTVETRLRQALAKSSEKGA